MRVEIDAVTVQGAMDAGGRLGRGSVLGGATLQRLCCTPPPPAMAPPPSSEPEPELEPAAGAGAVAFEKQVADLTAFYAVHSEFIHHLSL